jgi:hypothetical protein
MRGTIDTHIRDEWSSVREREYSLFLKGEPVPEKVKLREPGE